LQRAGQLVGHAHDDVLAASTDEPKLEREAVAIAREAARRRAAEQVPMPKIHQAPVDDDTVDMSWLDDPSPPSADPVRAPADPNKLKLKTPCPRKDNSAAVEMKCDSCANALDLLESPLAGLAAWARQHLASCPASPKAPGRPLAGR
jgi:hypothetical protein